MKLDKNTETILIFVAALIIIFTSYYVEKVAAENSVAKEYDSTLSLTGSRLSDEVYCKMDKSSQLPNKYGYGTQLDFEIYNNGKAGVSNWTAIIDMPMGTEVAEAWGVDGRVDKSRLILTPEYYNISLDAKSSISFGVILNSKEILYPTSIEFKGYRSQAEGGTIFRKIIYGAFIVWAILLIGFFVSRFNLKNYKEKQKNDVRIILQSMNTFISFIDAKDPYTRGHSRRVAMYAAEIAKRMRLSEDEIQNVYYAGLLHDAGKISVPDAVLNKPGRLTDDERRQIQDHTVAGGKMLKQMTSLRGIRETALYHHERFDGSGYPEGLKGESIPLYARIVGVADSYDAMSSNRVYRRHLSKDEIIEEIQKGSGTQFDPDIVTFMVDMINDGYVNVVKMETAEKEEGDRGFHLTEDDIPGVYMGF